MQVFWYRKNCEKPPKISPSVCPYLTALTKFFAGCRNVFFSVDGKNFVFYNVVELNGGIKLCMLKT